MNNNLEALNNYLFEQIERITDDNLSEEELKKEIMKSNAITKVAETIITNGQLALDTMKHMDEYGYNMKVGHSAVPNMLEAGNE